MEGRPGERLEVVAHEQQPVLVGRDLQGRPSESWYDARRVLGCGRPVEGQQPQPEAGLARGVHRRTAVGDDGEGERERVFLRDGYHQFGPPAGGGDPIQTHSDVTKRRHAGENDRGAIRRPRRESIQEGQRS